nr:MAG TPA: hypothetical protein [Caudoviricetes sp.]
MQIVCKCQKAYYARAEVLIKCKIENYGRADSLQNANHCRPTVFVYIEVAFKCKGEPCMPASNGTNYMLKQIL